MEEVVKELCEIFDKRCQDDCKIIAFRLGYMRANILFDAIEGVSTPFESACSSHRADDVQDLLLAYIAFHDKLEKVKNNMEYDKKHKR